MKGTVLDFDEHAGHGTVHTDDGRDLFFHCTQIADGTRTIAVGTRVEFAVVAGQRGQWEAAGVKKR
ncbi:MAG: cold shock domain-containing protein [Actinobacteria bacterium]|nr:cold shock domain-containing protein [Actinomycetota bacterium]